MNEDAVPYVPDADTIDGATVALLRTPGGAVHLGLRLTEKLLPWIVRSFEDCERSLGGGSVRVGRVVAVQLDGSQWVIVRSGQVQLLHHDLVRGYYALKAVPAPEAVIPALGGTLPEDAQG
jgi:hypothetical protein